MTVFVVVFSNYHPAEVDSIWSTYEKAEARARELNDTGISGCGWGVDEWRVQ